MNLGYSILSSIVFGNGKHSDLQMAFDITMGLARNGYSRQDELLADKLGVKYMMRAGYNPQASIDLLKKLLAQEKDEPGSLSVFFRSHPYASERIMAVEEQIGWLKASGQY
jgi:predicted Zn-dependent protease